jgi:hypothetical protein
VNCKEQLLHVVRCLVIYHFEVMESLKSAEDEEKEIIRFNKFLNDLIEKYDDLEGNNEI